MREKTEVKLPQVSSQKSEGLTQTELRDLPRLHLCWGLGEGSSAGGQYRYFLQVSASIVRGRVQKQNARGTLIMSPSVLFTVCQWLLLPRKESGDPSQRGESCPLPWAAGSNSKRSTVGQDRKRLSFLPCMGPYIGPPFCPPTSIYSPLLSPVGRCLQKMQMSSFRKRETFLPTQGEGQ